MKTIVNNSETVERYYLNCEKVYKIYLFTFMFLTEKVCKYVQFPSCVKLMYTILYLFKYLYFVKYSFSAKHCTIFIILKRN